jgi:hypothetical protein
MKDIIKFAIILAVGALIIMATSYVVNMLKVPDVKITEKVTTIEKVVKTPDCDNSFGEYKTLIDKGQYLVLAKDKSAYSANGHFVNDFIVNVNRMGDGKIACGYLYIKTRKDGHSLDPNYDSIYINPNDFGGHILRSKSLEIPQKEQNKTEVLLPTNSISYIPNVPYNPNAQDYKVSNWSNLFNVSDQINFKIGLSTIDPQGYIDQIIIAYKCWDPNTGLESHDCQLSLK